MALPSPQIAPKSPTGRRILPSWAGSVPAPVWIAVGALLLFGPFVGGVALFDWDEINFAQIAREMVERGQWGRVTIGYLPFWEKPPLFFWMQAALMQLIGVSETAARWPNVLCGAATLCLVYAVGRQAHSTRFGLMWALAYAGSLLPGLYFRSGLIDPWLNFFIFVGLYGLIRYSWYRQAYRDGQAPSMGAAYGWLVLGGLSAGLGVLTKGPVALLLIGLTALGYWGLQRGRRYFSWGAVVVYLLLSLVAAGAWFGIETALNGPWFVTEFLRYNVRLLSTPDAGHGGFPGYHVVVLLLGCTPASWFFLHRIAAARRYPRLETAHQQALWHWMQILFFVVLVVFSLVQSKIVHYSSMCYLPLTYGAALAIDAWLDGRARWPGWVLVGTAVVLGLLSVGALLFPLVAKEAHLLAPLLEKDPFAQGNLEAAGQMSFLGIEWLTGLLLAAGAGYGLWQIRSAQKRQDLLRPLKPVLWLFGTVAVSISLILYAYIGRIEWFSQGAAIEFMQRHADGQAHILAVGYRTYATLYYGGMSPANAPALAYARDNVHQALVPDRFRDSVLTAPTTAPGPGRPPVYVVTKIHKTAEAEAYGTLEEIGRQNGFVFYQRVR